MHLNMFVSQKCFLYCKGCYSFSRTEKHGQLVKTQKIVDFLRYAYDYGSKTVTLCGGDPLVRKDIIDLLQKLKQIGYYISLDTVGTSIIRNIKLNDNIIVEKTDAKLLAELVDEIGLPIDGSNNEIFRLFRQTDTDILSDQFRICEELNKYNANICINTVVHKGNISDASKLCETIKRINFIKKWQLFQYAPMGKYGIINRDLFEISTKEFEEYKVAILESFDRKDIVEFKGFDVRNKAYMLIDNSGNAWVPVYDQEVFNSYEKPLEDRKIIGNINDSKDWNGICKQLVIDQLYISQVKNDKFYEKV